MAECWLWRAGPRRSSTAQGRGDGAGNASMNRGAANLEVQAISGLTRRPKFSATFAKVSLSRY